MSNTEGTKHSKIIKMLKSQEERRCCQCLVRCYNREGVKKVYIAF